MNLHFILTELKKSKCYRSCNNTNDPYAKLCVADVVKNINVKVVDLISWTNETRHVKWKKTCKCKCRLNASAYNNKQRGYEDKCRRKCKELIEKEYVICGILVIVNVNVINHVLFENT